METAARNHEIVAENLANAATPGYRRHGSLFEFNPIAGNDPISITSNMTSAGRSTGYSNFESGPLQQTTNPLDFAIVGNGFFVLDGPNGPLYTRNGSFERSATGELRLRGSNYRLSGGVNIPPEADQITLSADGAIYANGTEVGRVPLATFDRPEAMRRVGTTLFEADNPQTPSPGDARVEQGYREGSNVQAVQEMVGMMLGMRHYEAAEKALRAISDAISQNTRVQQ
jgi:flagellar basal body rod protein FlgG